MITRRKILVAGGMGATAAALGGLIASGTDVARSEPSAEQDARVLTFVLGVERIEAAFYERAAQVGALTGELAEFTTTVLGHEREHVAYLERVLGSSAPEAPAMGDLDALVGDERRFIEAASALEDSAVAAYNGQATNLRTATLAEAARIVSVEARHAAWIRDIGGKPPAPDPVDAPLTADEIRASLREQGLLT